MTPFVKKLVTIATGVGLVAFALLIPESMQEWRTEVGGAGLFLIGLGIRAPGDSGGAGGTAVLGLALCLVAGCGATAQPTKTVLSCLSRAPESLVRDVQAMVVRDGDSRQEKASSQLMAAMRDTAGAVGVDMLRCALLQAGLALANPPEVGVPGGPATMRMESSRPSREAALSRTDDVLNRLLE